MRKKISGYKEAFGGPFLKYIPSILSFGEPIENALMHLSSPNKEEIGFAFFVVWLSW